MELMVRMRLYQLSGARVLKNQREVAPVRKNARRQVGTAHVRDSIAED